MPKTPPTLTLLNILIVEDSIDDTALLLHEIKAAGFDPQWKRVETETDYLAHLGPELTMILADSFLPQFSAISALALLQESKLEIPFIIVSGVIGEERVVESMKAGATDYVPKEHLHRLGPVMRRALREANEKGERKELEARVIEAQKMEVVGRLAGGVAHDFNNILGVIIGYDDLMLAEIESVCPLRYDPQTSLATVFAHLDDAKKYAGEIRHAAVRAVGLTRQLLLFSRKQPFQLVVLDLNEVVRGMEDMLRRLIDENIEMNFVPATPIGRTQADAGQVGQVLMNLIVNARDAIPDFGKVTIETRNVTLSAKEAGHDWPAKAGDYVMLSVTDDGMGMTDHVKAHLFEAFFTTKPAGKGTGLGLATCHTIVEQCGGHISVQSEAGKGSTFNVFFPRVDLPLDLPRHSAKLTPLPRGTETLLLIEDEPSVRHLACSILKEQGYNVLSAHHGEEGLRVARENQGEKIRLVIADVVMPQMGGQAAAEFLQATYPGIKILFTSGYTEEMVAPYGTPQPRGAAFLPKPYTPAALTRKVRELLDEQLRSEALSPSPKPFRKPVKSAPLPNRSHARPLHTPVARLIKVP